jgi:hypothetical protein
MAASRPNISPTSDLDDPSSLDPKTPPTSIQFPARAPKPFSNGIPVQPDNCDDESPSEDCFNALAKGGYLWFGKNSQCSEQQKAFVETAHWDALTLATYSWDVPNVPKGTFKPQALTSRPSATLR